MLGRLTLNIKYLSKHFKRKISQCFRAEGRRVRRLFRQLDESCLGV